MPISEFLLRRSLIFTIAGLKETCVHILCYKQSWTNYSYYSNCKFSDGYHFNVDCEMYLESGLKKGLYPPPKKLFSLLNVKATTDKHKWTFCMNKTWTILFRFRCLNGTGTLFAKVTNNSPETSLQTTKHINQT